eukprot:677956-Amphidinium_carterae.1
MKPQLGLGGACDGRGNHPRRPSQGRAQPQQGQRPQPGGQPLRIAPAPDAAIAALLAGVAADTRVDQVRTAPELLAVSMLQPLCITPPQAASLLADTGRRLARAFADASNL